MTIFLTSGLYNYDLTLHLRTMKQDVWDYQFLYIDCRNNGDISHFRPV